MTSKRETAQKTWVAIDLTALRGNLRAIAAAIGPRRSIILVVKSDAYGHGARSVVDVAAEEGVTRFGVATVGGPAGLEGLVNIDGGNALR